VFVEEPDHVAGLPTKIRDYEVDPRKKLSRVPLDLGNDTSRDVPTAGMIAKAVVQDNRLLRRTPYGTSKQVLDVAV